MASTKNEASTRDLNYSPKGLNYSPKGLNYSSGLSSPGVATPETVDEIPNESTPIVHPLSPGGEQY